MSQLNNAMEIFKLLDKSNCRECHESTCLAFAGAVFTGKRQLEECPHIDRGILERYSGKLERPNTAEEDFEKMINALKTKITSTDLSAAAQRLGVNYINDKISIKILGKDFSVDSKGNLSSDIHIHSWIAMPFLDYILNGAGLPVLGNWVPLRELPSGANWYRLFGQMCEKPLKKIADNYTDLFKDMIHIFNGREVENHYDSDISLVLYPLPKVPILICYWKPEDGLESDLHVFFDSTAEDNLTIESTYSIGVGLTLMFKKISLRHGS